MNRRFLSIVIGCGVIVAGMSLAWFEWGRQEQRPPVEAEHKVALKQETSEPTVPVSVPEPRPEKKLPASVLIPDVPFTTQAPNAEWSNPLFQDGCEEASLIMAEAWVQQRALSKSGVKTAIEKLSIFEKNKFGQAIDTSIQDTGSLLVDYFGITSGMVETGIGRDDIKRALADNRIVIVPTDGRKLNNPNFKRPGPPRHMLVIIGYDTAAQEFMVNDPGTRKGEGYRYPEAVLYDAILDYATGDHVPVTSTDKVMLTVGR